MRVGLRWIVNLYAALDIKAVELDSLGFGLS
jgi:hypothetical protein